MEEARKSTALPSPTPHTTQAIVDLAEHFNDSSLPRAFTALAVSRLGYRSVCVCTSKQLSNSKRTSRCLSINVRSRFLFRSAPFSLWSLRHHFRSLPFDLSHLLLNMYVMYFTHHLYWCFFILDLLLFNLWDPIICLPDLIFLARLSLQHVYHVFYTSSSTSALLHFRSIR